MAQTIKLNIIPKGIPDVVNVSQFDVGREITFDLLNGTSTYTIPSGATAVIGGRKKDNHVFQYAATINTGRQSITITTTEQMTACAGENLCQLRILKDDTVLATVNFKMMVQEMPDANGDTSDSDLPDIIAQATAQEQNAEAWAVGTKDGTPVTSSDPQYNNHAKYWAEYAQTMATSFKTKRCKVDASDWSESQNASGYYYLTLDAEQDFVEDPIPAICSTGATATTLATADEEDAYKHIQTPNGYVEHYSADTFKLYAKSKPDHDFYILIKGLFYNES